MKKIALIGSTGSIGRQAAEVVRRNPDRYKIVALVSDSDSAEFKKQVAEFRPALYACASVDKDKALEAAVAGADIVFNAAGGFAGLEYSLKAIRAGLPVALANKETLVCGGDFITAEAARCGSEIIPVDSEHSAIWQCLHFDKSATVSRLIITASGGAFRNFPPEKLDAVTPAQALDHPTWKMGKKITVDSATLMNKGYEVIEANRLFGVPYENIEAVIQPQSIIHSLAEFADGSCLAQMSYPTMEIPIQLALSYPERLKTTVKPLDFKNSFSLGFEPLERGKYPCFDLALQCGRLGGTAACALNAADEEAVKAFLCGAIKFTDIYRVLDAVMQSTVVREAESFACLADCDRSARESALKYIKRL